MTWCTPFSTWIRRIGRRRGAGCGSRLRSTRPWLKYCGGGLKGKAILGINDHPDIQEVFAGLHTEVLQISYLIGGGTHGAAARKELGVWSWDQVAEPAGLF
jgi:hypothetical protein